MEIQIYSCDIHAKKWRRECVTSHKDKEEHTQGVCVTFTQRKVRQFHQEKEAKRSGSPNKIRLMYEKEGDNKEDCS